MATGWTLDYIDNLPARQFREWQVYDRLFPFGDERADMRAGVSLQRPKTPEQVKSDLSHRMRGFSKG